MENQKSLLGRHEQSGVVRRCVRFGSVLSVVVSLAAAVQGVFGATAVSQYGITWTFSSDRPVGQFANGDWWVVGPVTITNIDPKTGDGGVTYSHGSMINLVPMQPQGFYNEGPNTSPPYDASRNISLRLPITIQPGNSVVSTMNNPHTWKGSTNSQGVYVLDPDAEKTYFKEVAVLTVLGSEPAAGSFRPPYAGSDKTIKSNWKVSSLNYSVLRNLTIPVPANAPSLAWLEASTQRPLFEIHVQYLNSNWKASWAPTKPGGYTRRAYGREIAHIASGAGLMLNSNYTNSQKEKLLINMVQWGIDTHGLLKAGMQWQPNGGHNHGRLLPIYIAGKVLNDPEILAAASGRSPFQEMINHQFVTREIVNMARAPHSPPFKPYTEDMIGMPEWSSGGLSSPFTSSEWGEGAVGQWWGVPYRSINGAPNCGTVAVILLMGGRAEVNQEAFFTYHIDRYYPRHRPTWNEPFGGDGNGVSALVRDFWDVHINGGTPPPYVPPTDPPVEPNPTFAVGDRIQVVGSAAVKATPSASSSAGYQNVPAMGTIVEGPVGPDGQNVTWFRIDYDSGIDGWTNRADFIKSQSPQASAFSVGDKVKVWRQSWVNSTASVTTGIGTQPAEATGTILEGPVTNSTDNVIWFRINYDTGIDGWSGADNLVRISSGSPPQPPTGVGTVVDPDGNWGFEDGVRGWTTSGNLEHHTSAPSKFAAEGLGFVGLNTGNRSPDAVLSRSVATVPGKSYLLHYRIGCLSYNQNSQSIAVKVRGTAVLAETTSSITGDGLGVSKWAEGEVIAFVADSASTLIEFRDISSTTNYIDLLFDDVVLVETE